MVLVVVVLTLVLLLLVLLLVRCCCSRLQTFCRSHRRCQARAAAARLSHAAELVQLHATGSQTPAAAVGESNRGKKHYLSELFSGQYLCSSLSQMDTVTANKGLIVRVVAALAVVGVA